MYTVHWPRGAQLKRGARFEIGLVIPVYERPEYLLPSWKALQESDLEGTLVMAVDDASRQPGFQEIFENLSLPEQPLLLAQRSEHGSFGTGRNLRFAFDFFCEHFDCKYFALLDSDTIMRPYWLHRLREIHTRLAQDHPRFFLTGFHTYNHPVLENSTDYRRKQTIGGLNLFFTPELYREVLRSCLRCTAHAGTTHWDWRLVRNCQKQGIPIFCTRPSVVQHIGRRGAWSRGSLFFDRALDYALPEPFAFLVHNILKAIRLLHKIFSQSFTGRS